MLIQYSMSREVITVGPEATVTAAWSLMNDNRIRHLPVVAPDRTLIGIVTDRDVRSALPHGVPAGSDQPPDASDAVAISEIMTHSPVTISACATIQDALLLFDRTNFGAFPVVDEQGLLLGIVSVKDMLRAFINVLGVNQPGTFLGILAEKRLGQIQEIVDTIGDEGIPLGSILVVGTDDENKRAVYPYLLSKQTGRLKRRLAEKGFTAFDPIKWSIDCLHAREHETASATEAETV